MLRCLFVCSPDQFPVWQCWWQFLSWNLQEIRPSGPGNHRQTMWIDGWSYAESYRGSAVESVSHWVSEVGVERCCFFRYSMNMPQPDRLDWNWAIWTYIRWYASDILGNIGNILSISMMEPLCLHRFVGLWGQLPEIRFSDLRRGMTYAVMEWCKTQHDANVAAMVFSHFKSSLVCLIDFFIPQSLPLGKFAAGSSSQWRIPLKWIERQGLSLWSSVITDHWQILPTHQASWCQFLWTTDSSSYQIGCWSCTGSSWRLWSDD